MRPFTYRRLTDEDLKDAPKGAWKGNLEYALNLFWQQLYNGLQNGLTPEENCQEQTVTFSIVGSNVTSKNNYTFATIFNYAPSFVEWFASPADGSVKTQAVEITGSYINGRYFISGIAGLNTGTTYNIVVRLWFPPQVPNGGTK